MPKVKIAQYLQSEDLPFEIFTHEAVYTARGADEAFGEIGIPSNKNLVLRNKKKTKFWMFTVRGDRQTDLRAIGDLVGDRVTFANDEHLELLLNTFAGACSPFGLVFDTEQKVEFWIEEDLTKSNFLGFHPNDNTETWRMEQKMFQAFIKSLNRPWQIAKF